MNVGVGCYFVLMATLMAMLPPGGWENVATKDDIRNLEVRMQAMESRLEARMVKLALTVNIPSILAAVGLSFAAVRPG